MLHTTTPNVHCTFDEKLVVFFRWFAILIVRIALLIFFVVRKQSTHKEITKSRDSSYTTNRKKKQQHYIVGHTQQLCTENIYKPILEMTRQHSRMIKPNGEQNKWAPKPANITHP